MPVLRGHGQSAATLAKQYALGKSLGYILSPAAAIAARDRMPCVIADMTAGEGRDRWGRDGSPLIIAERVKRLMERFGCPIKVLFTEHRKKALAELRYVVSTRYPDLNVSYFQDQSETIAAIPLSAYGLVYFDPNGWNTRPGKWDGLDTGLLAQLGQSRRRVDILITRECQASKRMQGASHCPGTLTIQDYLALTGKSRQWLLPYADYHWWTMGFATNWLEPAIAKMHDWTDVHGPDGPAIYAKWTKGMEDQAARARTRSTPSMPPTQEELPWGA